MDAPASVSCGALTPSRVIAASALPGVGSAEIPLVAAVERDIADAGKLILDAITDGYFAATGKFKSELMRK
jgi:hypothetical protein